VTVTDQGAEDDSIRGYRFRGLCRKVPKAFGRLWRLAEPGIAGRVVRDDDVTVMASRGSDIGPDPGL
jgi:hypothetical protein